jgi:prepilin-type N-terminal cleavage/methylation domain-containing protein
MRENVNTNQKGFSLLEVLICLVIIGFVATAAINIYLTQHQGWLIEEQISEMQQNARVAMRELAMRIRMAGYKVPGGIDPLIGKNTNPDTITILTRSEMDCEAPIEHAMPQPSSELRCDGHDVSCFKDDTWAYIYDPFAKEGEFFLITHVQVSASHIQHNTMELSKCYPQGSIVMSMDLYKYYIDNTTDPEHPKLMVVHEDPTPQVFAEDIEDLQFTYSLANGVFADTPPIGTVVREVNINLTARTEKKDLQFPGEYRKRILTSNVKVRNLGLQ